MSNDYLDLLAYFGIGGAHPGGFPLTQTILENENIQPGKSVLDIGCGTGQTAAFLASRFGCDVTAIDNHPIMVEKARERFINKEYSVKVIEGNIENLPFVDNSFDIILSESVIVFTNISKTLRELSRVLKRNGSMIMIEMIAEQTPSEELKRKVHSLYGIHEILQVEEWIATLLQAGFTHIETINISTEIAPTEISDINQSENINRNLYDLLEQHNEFMLNNGHLIGFRAFRCNID